MASFIEKLRMQNIFPSGGNNSVPFGMPQMDTGVNLDEITDVMNRIYPFIEKSRNAEQQFQKDMFNMQRQDQLKNIGQQMQQLGPSEEMKHIYENPPQITPFQRESLDIRKQELGQKSDIAGEKADVSRGGLNVRNRLADIQEFKAKNPQMKFMTPKGGNITAFNPLTGESIDTGIASGSLSDKERLDITGEQRMEQIGATGEQQRKTTELRGEQRLGEIGAQIAGRKEVQAEKPIRAELPTQTRVRQSNAVNQLVNTRPDLAKFIKSNPDGSFEVEPPSVGFFGPKGPTKQQFDEINKIIFGSPEVKKPVIPEKKPVVSEDKKPKLSDPLGIR